VKPSVLVSIVTYNSGEFLDSCLESLRRQTYGNFTVAVWDNASQDSTLVELEKPGTIVSRIFPSKKNIGFAAGHNRVLDQCPSDYVLFLNPDAVLMPDFLSNAVDIMEQRPACGSFSPKIYRLIANKESLERTSILDSTGMFWTRYQRHLDRGSGEEDRGQFRQAQYVFGVTGAVAFYRRSCLEDVSFEGEIWDEDFFLYREDADLAWRCAWRGWKCLFVPDVTAWHVRRVVPQNRRQTSSAANMHSIKNRFLFRIKNIPIVTWLKYFPWFTLRDLMIVGYVPFFEPRSLKAFYQVVRLWSAFVKKRRHVFQTARVHRKEMEYWLSHSSKELLPDKKRVHKF